MRPTNPALLASRVGKQQLTVAHVVEEQAGAGFVKRTLSWHDPARHILQGEAAQTRAHGEGLSAEELLQHIGKRLERISLDHTGHSERFAYG